MKRQLILTLYFLLSLLFPVAIGATAPGSTPSEFNDISLKPVTQRPCLLVDAAGIPEVKRRFEAMPIRPPADPKRMGKPLYALLYGDEAAKKEATADFLATLRKVFNNPVPNPLWAIRRTSELLYYYDIIASFGYLTKEEQQEFENDVVSAAKYYVGENPARFPSPQTPRVNGLEFPKGFSTCNRWADQVVVAGMVGLNFPEHPLSKAWVQYTIQQIQWQLDNGTWDGAWNECPRYHDAMMRIYSGFFQALKRRAGVDFYQNRNVKALLDWYVRFSSPLVRFPETTTHNPAGEPTLPVWGQSNYGSGFFSSLALYAPQYATTDPALAKRLMWMWRRAGTPSAGGSYFDLAFPMQADPSLPDEPQILGSDFCKDFGYVLMRSGFNTPKETAVYMRGGKRGVTHARSELGSIDLFSQGIPLALGSEAGPYGPGIEWNISQQSNNVVVFGGKSRNHGESNGKIDAWFTNPQVDYAVADCSCPASRYVKPEEAFHWCRHLLLVKNPDYLVVWDEISSPMPSEYVLHTTAEKLIWGKNLITSRTAYNADLDIHVLAPSNPLAPNEKEGRFGAAMEDPKHPGKFAGKQDPYPFNTLKYLSIPAKPGESFLTVLHPRRPDGAPLTATLVSSSNKKITLKLANAGKTDLVTLGVHGASFQRGASPAVAIPMLIQK